MDLVGDIPADRCAEIESILERIPPRTSFRWNCRDWVREAMDAMVLHRLITAKERDAAIQRQNKPLQSCTRQTHPTPQHSTKSRSLPAARQLRTIVAASMPSKGPARREKSCCHLQALAGTLDGITSCPIRTQFWWKPWPRRVEPSLPPALISSECPPRTEKCQAHCQILLFKLSCL